MTDDLPAAPTLDVMIARFDLPPRSLQCFDPAHPWVDAQRPLLVLPPEFDAARAALATRYPSTHSARTLRDGAVAETTMDALPGDAHAWLLDALPAEQDVRGLYGLRAVVERLVAPGGCPWDAEQTPETLRKHLVEETFEAVDAIDRGDMDALREELGDLLMHVLMQAALAAQRGDFRLEDVLGGITAKMVRRHPHVFGEEAFESQERLLDRWEEIKAAERTASGSPDTDPAGLEGVPLALPALQRAQSLLGRARRLPDGGPVPVGEAQARQALERFEAAPSLESLGALLWALASRARQADLDAEEALRQRANAFVDAARASEGGAHA